MPSLRLTVGQCQEGAGRTELARHHYEHAAVASHVLGDDGYGQML